MEYFTLSSAGTGILPPYSPIRKQYLRWAGRHGKTPFFRWLDGNVHLLQLAWAVFLFIAGGASGYWTSDHFDKQRAMGWMVYGVFAKTLFVIYLANIVDLINHGPGYRNYETRDRSSNSFIMAMVHLGGAISWHNNHYARPDYFSVKRTVVGVRRSFAVVADSGVRGAGF